MKKALGLLAVVGAAATYAAYKISHEEPSEEEKIIHELDDEEENENQKQEDSSTEEISAQILKNVEDAGFEPVEEENSEGAEDLENPEVVEFTSTSFPNLEESDIIEITNNSEEGFKKMEDLDEGEERPIEHRVSFDDEKDAEEFKSVAIGQGYVITESDDNEILVLNISKLNQDDILAKVFYLADLCKANHGEYKGWTIK